MVATESPPGATVWVATNGGTSKEYEDNDILDNHESATRYIEAVEGQDFWVVVSLDRTIELLGQGIRLKVWVDGQLVATRTIHQDKIQRRGYTHVVKGFQCSERLRKDFCFATLRTDEDGETDALDAERVEHVGSIAVEIHHVKNFREVEVTGTQESAKSFAKDFEAFDVVSEKALKGRAISHSVSLKEVPLKAPKGRRGAGNQRNTRTHSEFVDPSKQPAATYTIRYRSRDALKSMLILPRSRQPTPARSPSPPTLTRRDPNSLSQAEVAEMQKRLQEFENQSKSQAKVKREQNENSPPRRKTRKSGEITIIELDDDGEIVSETSMRQSESPDAMQLVDID